MEDVRLLVQEEGRAARNLIAFHVDVATPVTGKVLNRKPPSSPRLLNDIRMTKRSAIVAKTGSRVRSASTGRDKKSELQARYWAFLFGNLQRAVDEIYQTCESDESVSECKEVILVLENFTRDFHNLIEWFRLKWEYENTPPPQRPTSLAWEVRKSSPNKAVNSSRIDKGRSGKSSPAKKQLDFLPEVKLSSADEVSRRAPTPDSEQILSNQYGLSFGDIDLKDHLQVSGSVVQKLGDNNTNCNMSSIGNEGKNEGDNKENYPSIIVENNINNVEKIQTEVLSINQSSQTDVLPLQSNKVGQKIVGPLSQQITKKPPASTAKLNVNTTAKPPVVLTPLAVNKTTPGVSVRKTVPLSPTNTVPPRNVVPGRNVAAAAFVPSKKTLSLTQHKIHPFNVNKTSTISRTQNTPTQVVDTNINSGETLQKVPLDTNRLVATSDNSAEVSNTSMKDCSVNLINNKVTVDLKMKNNVEEMSKCDDSNSNCIVTSSINDEPTITSILSVRSEHQSKEEKELKLCDSGNKEEIDKSLVVNNKKISANNLSDNSIKNTEVTEVITVNNKKDYNSVTKSSCTIDTENNKIENKNILNPEKCDKIVMTDFPIVNPAPHPVVKQQVIKVVPLIRNKTVPNFIRKSNETLSVSDSLTESQKLTRSNTVNPAKSLSNIVRKQLTIPETVNVKPAHSPVTKVFRSNTALELRPSKLNRNTIGGASRNSSQLKQVSLLHKSKSSANKNEAQIKDSNEIFKSEQSLKKKNSIDEDGWETVKGRSRWRLSQSSGNIKSRIVPASSRFYLPSPATSLPALALASEDSETEVKPAKVHKDKQNQEIAKANKLNAFRKMASTPKHAEKSEVDNRPTVNSTSKNTVIERKSKMISNDRKRVSNAKSNILTSKKVDRDEKPDSAENKIEKYMDILSSEDERMNEEEIRKSMELYEEEKMLTKEIQDLEKAAIEMDTETDDAETDGETTAGTEEDEDTDCRITALRASYEDVCHQLSWADQMDTLEKLEKLMAMDTSSKGIPFSERLTTLEQLEELVARHPGRALELHQKLSSPSRRRPLPDTIQRHHARQASAKQKREQLLHDKSAKMRELLNKVEEVKMAQAHLVEERKKRLADKLKRAEENRASHLRSIQRKAHDEEEKLREIAFINELEAQNKRHDFMALCQEQQDRLQGILDERQRRLEEKAAKEAAVEERRRILEAERQDKLEKMQERRRKREERIGREQQEKEKERLELAREKARDREERLQALQAAQLATVEELQKKIQQKQFDSARRHEENIEHIRQRALESGALRSGGDEEAPRLTPYDTHKMCSVCNVLIESEVHLLSHLRGKAHQEAVKDRDDSEEVIVDAPPDKMNLKLAQDRERQKALRKRCKKIRARMSLRGEEYHATVVAAKKLESPNKGRLFKCLKDVDKQQVIQGLGQWPNNAITLLERNLGEIVRILDKQNVLDQKVFRELNGFSTLSNILNLALDIPKNMSPYLPPKCFLTTCTVYTLACSNNPDNSRFVFLTNKIALVLDLLLNRLNALITDDYKSSNKTSTNLPVDPVAGALMKLFALILSNSQDNITIDVPDMAPRLQDIISYTVSVGVVDKLALYCRSVQEPIDNPQAAQFLLSAMQLLTTLSQTKCGLAPTQLVATLRVTELVGAVSMLYCNLLHQGGPPKEEASLPAHAVAVTSATLRLLKAVAQLDLNMFQSVLGAEGMSLQLRHIASYLLWYCSHTDEKDLLHQVIEVVGYFAVMHYDNQMMLQSGHMPTVLQQLCNLPFEYFSDPVLSCHLFPSLLACCHGNAENRAILEQELSYQLLEDFKNSESALSNPLVLLLK